MNSNVSPIRVRVDPANPGEFFGCCGLLELADRLWPGVEGWFEDSEFFMRLLDSGSAVEASLAVLVEAISKARMRALNPQDACSSPIEIPAPFGLRLDWWKDVRAGGKNLKPWAGRMRGPDIAAALQSALPRAAQADGSIFDYAEVLHSPESGNKVEPYYFDARRGANAAPLDIGFSPDPLKIRTVVHPAVEFFALVGLQRFRPIPCERRVFEYHTWAVPLEVRIAPVAACGLIANAAGRGFRFENAFRTDKKRHKAFNPAMPCTRSRQ